MVKVFYLEGPDLAGKSTLATQLAKMYFGSVIHFGPPTTDDVFEQYGAPIHQAYHEAKSAGCGALIIDRAHISEQVYGPILRGHIAGKRWQWKLLESALDQLGTTRLYVNPGRKVIRNRLLTRGEDFVTEVQLDRVQTAYNRLLLNHPKWTHIDANAQKLMEVLTK